MIIGLIIFFALIWIIFSAFHKNKTAPYDNFGNVTGYSETETAGNKAAGCLLTFIVIIVIIIAIIIFAALMN